MTQLFTKTQAEDFILLAESARTVYAEHISSQGMSQSKNAFFSAALRYCPELDAKLGKMNELSLDERISYCAHYVLDTHYPYNEAQPFFEDRASGFSISNPYSSSCGRFTVDPNEEYPDFHEWKDEASRQRRPKPKLP